MALLVADGTDGAFQPGGTALHHHTRAAAKASAPGATVVGGSLGVPVLRLTNDQRIGQLSNYWINTGLIGLINWLGELVELMG